MRTITIKLANGKTITKRVDERGIVPNGGTNGQVLAKTSDDDYAVDWVDAGSGDGDSDLTAANGVEIVETDDSPVERVIQLGGTITDIIEMALASGARITIGDRTANEPSITLWKIAGSPAENILQLRNGNGDNFATLTMDAIAGGAQLILFHVLTDGVAATAYFSAFGLVYDDDYASRNESNPRWIPDMAAVDAAITAAAGTPLADGNGIYIHDGVIDFGGSIDGTATVNMNEGSDVQFIMAGGGSMVLTRHLDSEDGARVLTFTAQNPDAVASFSTGVNNANQPRVQFAVSAPVGEATRAVIMSIVEHGLEYQISGDATLDEITEWNAANDNWLPHKKYIDDAITDAIGGVVVPDALTASQGVSITDGVIKLGGAITEEITVPMAEGSLINFGAGGVNLALIRHNDSADGLRSLTFNAQIDDASVAMTMAVTNDKQPRVQFNCQAPFGEGSHSVQMVVTEKGLTYEATPLDAGLDAIALWNSMNNGWLTTKKYVDDAVTAGVGGVTIDTLITAEQGITIEEIGSPVTKVIKFGGDINELRQINMLAGSQLLFGALDADAPSFLIANVDGNYQILMKCGTADEFAVFSLGYQTYSPAPVTIQCKHDGDFAEAKMTENGWQYTSDYAARNAANDRWLPDMAAVLAAITAGIGGIDPPDIPTALADLSDDATHRLVTDTEKTQWNAAEPNVQSDWDAVSGDAQILNKPTIPAVANNADNRLITGGSGQSMNGESNVTFDGTTLAIAGQISVAYDSAAIDAISMTNSHSGGHSWRIGDGSGATAGSFGIYDATETTTRFAINGVGEITISNLAGTGSRMVVVDANGKLDDAALPVIPDQLSDLADDYLHRTITDAKIGEWDAKGVSNLQLGESSTTAYRGDRGKTAYDHSQTAHAPSNAEANVQSDWNAGSGDAQILNKPTILSMANGANNFVLTSVDADSINAESNLEFDGSTLKILKATADTLPTLGNHGTHFEICREASANDGGVYGLTAGVLSTGDVYMQAQRTDGTATAYNIQLNPNGGAVLLPLGTELLPSYSFLGDPNTGIWAQAADVIGVSLGGDEKYRFTGGNFHVAGDVVTSSTTTPSDRRLKRNIKPIVNALKRVLQLAGKTFTMKSDKTDTVKMGLIAQDVEKICPEVVKEHEMLDGKTYKTIDYPALIPMLIESIKEQQTQINELRAMVDGLRDHRFKTK